MTDTAAAPVADKLGWAGLALGGAALVLTLVHFTAGPFEPTPALEDTIADTAKGIRDAVERAMSGDSPPPEPVARSWTIDRALAVVAAVAAATVMVLSITALALGAQRRLAVGGAVLGATAIATQVVIWAVLMIVGALLIWAIIENLGGILGE